MISSKSVWMMLKWIFGVVTGIVALVIGTLSIISSFSFDSEKTALREFQKQMKEEVGKLEAAPVVELFGENGEALSGHHLPAKVTADQDGRLFLRVSHRIRNSGEGATGQMWIRLYTNDPIRLGNPSSDERSFKYETIVHPSKLSPAELPGKISSQWYLNFLLRDETAPKKGQHPALLRVYYGKGRVAQANVILVIADAER